MIPAIAPRRQLHRGGSIEIAYGTTHRRDQAWRLV
jgi:hypothetical protein